MVPEPISETKIGLVAGVLHMGNVIFLQIGEDLLGLCQKQRPDEPSADWGYGGKTVETTATDQVQQHGLQVVLGRVGGGDLCVRGQPHEEFIAEGPSGILGAQLVGRSVGGYITPANR
jgi:hypothetical protein